MSHFSVFFSQILRHPFVPSFFHQPSASKGRQDWNLMTQRLAHFSSLQHSSVISLISATKVVKITLKHHEIGFESQKSIISDQSLLRYQPIIFHQIMVIPHIHQVALPKERFVGRQGRSMLCQSKCIKILYTQSQPLWA